MVRQVDVAPLPAAALEVEADCFVVIDAFRATTTVAALFANGLQSLVAAGDISVARRLARDTGGLLFGEVGGLPPPGFDYGNSPIEAASAPVAGRSAVLFTTNGTRALVGCAARGPVLAGCFANASAVAAALDASERILLVCAGNGGGTQFSLEDFAAAGAIARALLGRDAGIRAADACLAAMAVAPSLAAASSHAAALRELGLGADVEFALRIDSCPVVPVVVGFEEGVARLGLRA